MPGSLDPERLLKDGQEALAVGQWETARIHFEAATTLVELPEAFEGLGIAAFWMEDGATALAARERAYVIYRKRKDEVGAARVAIALADDYFTFRDQAHIANGWLLRARRLLERHELCVEHGWLASEAGYLALLGRHDAVVAGVYGTEARECGRALGSVDLEMHGLALEGLAMVSRGDVDEGMLKLDEATTAATSGEMQDPSVIGVICCYLIFACEWTRDYPRAVQWCQHVREFCEERKLGSLLGVCRAHHASVLTWQGQWAEAEEQLQAASSLLNTVRPALANEVTVRLGELRRRQGRLAEALALFEQAAAHPLAALGRAEISLESKLPADARDWAERFLRRLPDTADTERSAGLEVLVRARLALGEDEAARPVASEIAAIAARVRSGPLRAASLAVQGLLAMSDGELARAVSLLEDAAELYDRSSVPFEAAVVRTELASAYRALNQASRSEAAAELAITAFGRLGRALELLSVAPASIRPGLPSNTLGLTARETEVLALIGNGLSNHEIAAELVLSVRTVERHISTVYEKLGAHGKAARATASAHAVRHGLA